MALGAGSAFLDIIPRLAEGFGKKISDEVEPEVEKSSERAGGIFKSKFAAAGAAGAIALGAGFLGALDVQAAQGKLSAQLGLSTQAAEVAGKAASNLYKGAWGGSIEEVNEAIKSVGLNLSDISKTSQGDLEQMTSRVIDLSTAFDEDFNHVASSTANLLKTGLAPSAEAAFDTITRGFQLGVDKAQDFLDTLNEYAQPLKSLGLDANMATGLLNQGLKAGARNADLVADALKEFSIRSKDASTTSAQGYQLIGLNASQMTAQMAKGGEQAKAGLDVVLDRLSKMTDPVKRNAAAVALFGTQAEDLQGALFALDPTTAVDSLGKVTGAAGELSNQINNNSKTTLESFKRQALQGLVDFLGGTVIPKFTEVNKELGEKFGPNFDKVKTGVIVGVSLMGAAVAFHAATIVAGWVAMGTASVINSAKMVAGWAASGAAAIASGATTAAVAALYVADWILMGLQATVNAAKVVAGWVATGAGAIAAGAVMAAQVALMVAGWVLLGVQSLLNAAKVAAAWLIAMGPIALVIAAVIGLVALIIANWDTISDVTKKLWEGIKNATAAAWDWIKDSVAKAFDFLKNVFLNFTGPGLIIKHWQDIKDATGAAWSWVQDKISGVIDWFGGVPGKIQHAAAGMWDGISNGFKTAINFIIRGWNSLEFKVPGFDAGPVHFGGFTLGVPDIPMLAKGGKAKGWFVAGEEGAELGYAGTGGVEIFNHDDSLRMLQGSGGEVHNHYELTIKGEAPKSLVDQFREMERLSLPMKLGA